MTESRWPLVADFLPPNSAIRAGSRRGEALGLAASWAQVSVQVSASAPKNAAKTDLFGDFMVVTIRPGADRLFRLPPVWGQGSGRGDRRAGPVRKPFGGRDITHDLPPQCQLSL